MGGEQSGADIPAFENGELVLHGFAAEIVALDAEDGDVASFRARGGLDLDGRD